MSKFAFSPDKTYSWDTMSNSIHKHDHTSDSMLDVSRSAGKQGWYLKKNHPEGVLEFHVPATHPHGGHKVYETQAKHEGEAQMKILAARKRSGDG